LANALFTLTGSDGSKQTIGTGGDGKVFFENLVYGVTYTWEETKAPHGYQLSENNTGTWTVGKHDDSITITCENQRRPGSISVLKQDSDGNPLSGCTFLLEYYNGSVWKPVVSRSDGVITKGYTTTPGVTDGCLTTGAIGTVTFEGLYADDETKYRLTEIATPDGYELLGKPVFEGTLPVEADASTVTGTPDEVVGETAYFYTLPITVRNGKSYVLPMTGGDDFPFFPIALLIMTAGIAIYAYSARRDLCRRAKHLIKKLY
ncbi:MAG: SpaA isopeptide-forming pilin-related protein, partial [Oscillospiraceae bacterium]|nr:SpaA isopeptide-forming pilin-related protein [Oscillospiraceae bacterium]